MLPQGKLPVPSQLPHLLLVRSSEPEPAHGGLLSPHSSLSPSGLQENFQNHFQKEPRAV
ncbi:hypothetical protein GBAR_LOCUS25734, partial [Geodia barretti]